jgi:hypothetical protein
MQLLFGWYRPEGVALGGEGWDALLGSSPGGGQRVRSEDGWVGSEASSEQICPDGWFRPISPVALHSIHAHPPAPHSQVSASAVAHLIEDSGAHAAVIEGGGGILPPPELLLDPPSPVPTVAFGVNALPTVGAAGDGNSSNFAAAERMADVHTGGDGGGGSCVTPNACGRQVPKLSFLAQRAAATKYASEPDLLPEMSPGDKAGVIRWVSCNQRRLAEVGRYFYFNLGVQLSSYLCFDFRFSSSLVCVV